jgi:hypothetical protein
MRLPWIIISLPGGVGEFAVALQMVDGLPTVFRYMHGIVAAVLACCMKNTSSSLSNRSPRYRLHIVR